MIAGWWEGVAGQMLCQTSSQRKPTLFGVGGRGRFFWLTPCEESASGLYSFTWEQRVDDEGLIKAVLLRSQPPARRWASPLPPPGLMVPGGPGERGLGPGVTLTQVPVQASALSRVISHFRLCLVAPQREDSFSSSIYWSPGDRGVATPSCPVPQFSHVKRRGYHMPTHRAS